MLCSGKVYVDLVGDERRHGAADVAICRVEQLYPVPHATARGARRLPALDEVVWLQEEPENMGAWEFMRPRLEELIGHAARLRGIGRQPGRGVVALEGQPEGARQPTGIRSLSR